MLLYAENAKLLHPCTFNTVIEREGGRVKEERWLTEVRVLHGLASRESLAMVVAQEFVEKVEGLAAHQMLVFTVNKLLPPLARVSGVRRGEENEGRRDSLLKCAYV